RPAALPRDLGCVQPPEGPKLALVGLADEEALFALADAVELGVLPVIPVGPPRVFRLVEVQVAGLCHARNQGKSGADCGSVFAWFLAPIRLESEQGGSMYRKPIGPTAHGGIDYHFATPNTPQPTLFGLKGWARANFSSV